MSGGTPAVLLVALTSSPRDNTASAHTEGRRYSPIELSAAACLVIYGEGLSYYVEPYNSVPHSRPLEGPQKSSADWEAFRHVIRRLRSLYDVALRDTRQGAYMLRTNMEAGTAEELWSRYMQLTEAGASFRAEKRTLHPALFLQK